MTINRLGKRLKEYFTTVDEGTDIPKEKKECEKLIKELRYDQRYLEDAIQQLEKSHQECTTLISNLVGADREREEHLYDKYTKEDLSNFLTLLDKAEVVSGVIDVRISQS